MKHFLFVFLLLTYSTSILSSMVPNDCLDLYWEGAPKDSPEYTGEFDNLDSVLVDTCNNSPTFRKLFVDGPYQIVFDYNIIPRSGIFDEDTLIKYSISDILPKYSSIITDFQNLENEIGEFYFYESHPHRPDTNEFINRSLMINFSKNLEIEAIKEKLESLNGVKSSACRARFTVLTSVENLELNNIVYNSHLKTITIYRNESSPSDLMIYNLSGIKILSFPIMKQNETVSLENIERGLYLVKYNKSIKKIIIQ